MKSKLVPLFFAVCCVASSGTRAAPPSLFDRIGGQPVMSRVLDQMLDGLAHDPAVNQSFAGVDLAKLSHKLYVHLCAATGGPCRYAGEDMKTVHAGLHISPRELDASVTYLVVALDANGVGPREKQELLEVLKPLGPDVVSP